MLLMMVSLTAVCQYPVTKKIGSQEVVIMTTKQAEAINNKFLRMKDTIYQLKQTNTGLITQQVITIDSLKKTHVDYKTASSNADLYRLEYYNLRKDYTKAREQYNRDNLIMLGAMTVFTLAITLFTSRFN